MEFAVKIGLFIMLAVAFSLFSMDTKKEHADVLIDFDSIVEQTIEEFNIPGLSIGVIVDGNVILSRGYGVRGVNSSLAVNESTLFPIGSCTKAFTSFLAGTLVDEGKLDIDRPIIHYFPKFKVKDEEIGKRITMVDLLSHRTGLPANDEVWYGKPELSRMEIVEKIQFLDFTEELGTKLQYNNLMYVVAGVVTEKITGKTWEENVKDRILNPLRMTQTNFSIEEMLQKNNIALPHTTKNGSADEISFRHFSNAGPAGTINSNVVEMLHWIDMLLNKGTYKGNKMIEPDTLNSIFTPRIGIDDPRISMTEPINEDRKLVGYCLGWGLIEYQGHRIISHDGGIDGFRSKLVLIPDHKIGLVILSNNDIGGGYATNALSRTLIDRLLGVDGKDWVSEFKHLYQEKEGE